MAEQKLPSTSDFVGAPARAPGVQDGARTTGDAERAVRRSTGPSPPLGMSPELAGAVTRALRHLPDELLRAMAQGLPAHADELAPGVLFRGTSSGGCAVGITLRELAPDAFKFGWVRFWLRQRWRRGIERDVACRYPRLTHLQSCFDEAVAELKRAGYEPQPAQTVGLWLAAMATAELRARGSTNTEKRSRPRRPAQRTHRRSDGPRRDHQHEVETTIRRSSLEVSRWS